MDVGEMIAVGFGGVVIAVVLWNMRPQSPHNTGDPEAWQSGEDIGHNDH